MNSKNRIVVLGAGGFVGGSIYNFLNKNKFFAIPIDRNKIDFLRNNSSKLLKNLVKKNDIIINAIAIAPCKTFSDFLKNLSIIHNIQNALAGREIKKYINISSDAVYSDKKTRISEQDIPRPTTLHGLMHLRYGYFYFQLKIND